MWEEDNEGFVACFLIKKGKFIRLTCTKQNGNCPIHCFIINCYADGSKTGHGRRGYLQEGAWDAIHVIEVDFNCQVDTKYIHGGYQNNAPFPCLSFVATFQIIL